MTVERSPYLVGKAFQSFLLASVLTAAASQVGALVDGMMLSHFINANAMSAINICMPVTQTLYALCVLVGVGGTMLAGMAIGNHRRDEASLIFSTVMISVLLAGLVLGGFGLLFRMPLVSLLCPDPALKSYTAQYLGIILPAACIYMIMVAGQLFVTLDGEPARVTLAVTASMAVNLVLDYIAIVWLGMGMTGAALATVISYAAAICVLAPHFWHPDALRCRLPKSGRQLWSIAAMGLPFGIATALIAIQILGSNLVAIHYLGEPGIVTLSVCMYLLSFSMIILTGTLESFQPVASILKGAGDNRGVFLVLGRAYMFMSAALIVFAFVLVAFPDWIAALFGINQKATLKMMLLGLPAYAANIALQCLVYLLIPVYQLYGHKKLAFFISFGQPLLPVCCFWIMSALYVSGGHNPWWGFAVGQIMLALILLPFIIKPAGQVIPLALIPRDKPEELLDASISPSLNAMTEALSMADGWLADNGVAAQLRNRVVLALEEMLKNIISHGLTRRQFKSKIDVRLAIKPDKVLAIIRDEGRPFNPVRREERPVRELVHFGLGLYLISKTSDMWKYEYVFHQNFLQIEWNRS